MSVKERVKIFLEYKKLTVSAFEKSIGASNGYVNSISKSIGVDKIELILEKYPILNIEWLLTGKGSMLKNENKSSVNQNITGSGNIQSGNDTTVTGDNKERVKELQKQLQDCKKLIKEKELMIKEKDQTIKEQSTTIHKLIQRI